MNFKLGDKIPVTVATSEQRLDVSKLSTVDDALLQLMQDQRAAIEGVVSGSDVSGKQIHMESHVSLMSSSDSTQRHHAIVPMFEKKIGYAFHDRDLLQRALTHASGAVENSQSNEVLEFFGDAVLQLIVTEALLQESVRPGSILKRANEGVLTFSRSALVSKTHLAGVAEKLEIGRHMIVGNGMTTFSQKSIADATEAVIGAVHIDGGIHNSRSFVREHVLYDMEGAIKKAVQANSKSRLQWAAQMIKGCHPEYKIDSESGPDHDKFFEVTVYIGGEAVGKGSGKSKKGAEHGAALNAIAHLGWEERTREMLS